MSIKLILFLGLLVACAMVYIDRTTPQPPPIHVIDCESVPMPKACMTTP